VVVVEGQAPPVVVQEAVVVDWDGKTTSLWFLEQAIPW
jgi:hypothetical protein